MALKQQITLDGKSYTQTDAGVIDEGTKKVSFIAYVKIVSISGNKENIYAAVEFSGDSQKFTKNYRVPVTVNDGAENFIKQAYEYIKKLPEFDGAQDC